MRKKGKKIGSKVYLIVDIIAVYGRRVNVIYRFYLQLSLYRFIINKVPL